MPFPGEHAARLLEPTTFQRFRRENDALGDGIHAIWGVAADGAVELQSIRFDADQFTPEEARTWLGEHDYADAELEEAEAVQESAPAGRIVCGTDGFYRTREGVDAQIIQSKNPDDILQVRERLIRQIQLNEAARIREELDTLIGTLPQAGSGQVRAEAWRETIEQRIPWASPEARRVLAGYYDRRGHVALARALRCEPECPTGNRIAEACKKVLARKRVEHEDAHSGVTVGGAAGHTSGTMTVNWGAPEPVETPT